MAPKKKTSTMIWVKKSQQPGNIAKPETSKKDSSPLQEEISKLQLSSATKEDATYVLGWSLLPEELLQIISDKLDDCFDIIHARSVCRPWRSTFAFPSSSLLRTRYSLPSFEKFPRRSKGTCTLEKFPMFLFRVRAKSVVPALPSEFFIGGIDQDKSKDQMERSSSVQCSVKVKIAGSDPTSMNMLDCQILPLGYQYRMIGYDPNSLATSFTGVGFLPLNKGYVVLIGYSNILLALRSSEMRWRQLERTSRAQCKDIVIFRGKFYVVFLNGDVFVIDPYSLEGTPLIHVERLTSQNYLVPYGDEEVFLVERIIVRGSVLCFSKLTCRVSRLDEEAGEWVVVNELGNRVLLIGQPGNSSCSAKELPDGCGVSGDSMLFTNEIFDQTYPYKYGVDTGNAEDDMSLWRSSKETDVTIFSASPMVALRIEAKL